MDDTAPILEVLLPPGHCPLLPDDTEEELSSLFDEPRSPWVRATIVSTLDGAATGEDGRAGSITGSTGQRVFRTLRARADAVLVGAATVRAEQYRAPHTLPALRPGRRMRDQVGDPPLAIVTATGVLPVSTLIAEPIPWVFTTRGAENLDHLRRHLPSDHLHVAADHVDLAAVITTLAENGLGRILTEGGPHLLGQLMEAGLVDELCLTWSPTIVGGTAMRIVSGAGWLSPPPTPRLAHLLHADGFLLGRWLLNPGAARHAR
jgi:riboflavin biosynthesis pyrimidine reductase